MLITKELIINLYGTNIAHFREKNYDIPMRKDANRNRYYVPRNTNIHVKVDDLPSHSSAIVECLCDYCLLEGKETKFKVTYANYLRSIENPYSQKNACEKCAYIKCNEVKIIKYGSYNIQDLSKILGFKLGRHKLNPQVTYDAFINRNLIPLFDLENVDTVKDKLPFLCHRHLEKGVQYICYDKIRSNETLQGCPSCNMERGNDEKRYSFEFVKSKFEDKNYTLLSSTYKNCDNDLEFICNKHSEEGVQTTTLWSVLDCNHNCKICRYQQTSDENHWNWQGGISLERDKIKQTQEYQNWRIQVFQRDNYTCQCCGERSTYLNAHHLYNFSQYPDLRMDINNGITLCEQCHGMKFTKSFHNIYGYRNNTPEELQEYIAMHKNGEFKI